MRGSYGPGLEVAYVTLLTPLIRTVTCPPVIAREAGKVSESGRKGSRVEKPIAVPATGFCRLPRATLFHVVATSHSQDSGSCTRGGQGFQTKAVRGSPIRASYTGSGECFQRASLGVPMNDQVRDSRNGSSYGFLLEVRERFLQNPALL